MTALETAKEAARAALAALAEVEAEAAGDTIRPFLRDHVNEDQGTDGAPLRAFYQLFVGSGGSSMREREFGAAVLAAGYAKTRTIGGWCYPGLMLETRGAWYRAQWLRAQIALGRAQAEVDAEAEAIGGDPEWSAFLDRTRAAQTELQSARRALEASRRAVWDALTGDERNRLQFPHAPAYPAEDATRAFEPFSGPRIQHVLERAGYSSRSVTVLDDRLDDGVDAMRALIELDDQLWERQTVAYGAKVQAESDERAHRMAQANAKQALADAEEARRAAVRQARWEAMTPEERTAEEARIAAKVEAHYSRGRSIRAAIEESGRRPIPVAWTRRVPTGDGDTATKGSTTSGRGIPTRGRLTPSNDGL